MKKIIKARRGFGSIGIKKGNGPLASPLLTRNEN
jgi:hypothetical protein